MSNSGWNIPIIITLTWSVFKTGPILMIGSGLTMNQSHSRLAFKYVEPNKIIKIMKKIHEFDKEKTSYHLMFYIWYLFIYHIYYNLFWIYVLKLIYIYNLWCRFDLVERYWTVIPITIRFNSRSVLKTLLTNIFLLYLYISIRFQHIIIKHWLYHPEMETYN